MSHKSFILSAKRTPIGSFGGSLVGHSAVSLGIHAAKAALENIEIAKINECIFGNVVSSGLGQAPARQVALGAGLDLSVPCTTINKVCASGMKSIMLGAQGIRASDSHVVLAGGMESMSNIPFYAQAMRWGAKYGNQSMIDGLDNDGLKDAYSHQAMGVFADNTAKEYNISRQLQDEYAIESYQRAQNAHEKGLFATEIAPIEIKQGKGVINFEIDEECKKVNFDKIPVLRPAFGADGTATAANSSSISDGAAALVLACEHFVEKRGLQPMAEIISYSDAALAPEWFTVAPCVATEMALNKAGLKISDIDFFEVNEAFSTVTLTYMQKLGISRDKVNVWGGGVALGHPLGCSGARIVVTLLHILQHHGAKYGLATLCNGGGGASAIIVKNLIK